MSKLCMFILKLIFKNKKTWPTCSPGSPGSPGSPLIMVGSGGNSTSVQTKLHPSEQHFSPTLHSLSSKHAPGISSSGLISLSHRSNVGRGHWPGRISGSKIQLQHFSTCLCC